MEIKVIVVDDEELARARFCNLLKDCKEPSAIIAGQAFDFHSTMDLVKKVDFDLAFLDIHMPNIDGMKLGAELKKMPNPPLIIFVTAHAQHAVDAFEIEALDYLTKPVRLERLQLALQKASKLIQPKKNIKKEERFVLITERGATSKILLSDIIYFKAELKYITVKTINSEYIIESSLNTLQEKCTDEFLRVHRNALVSRKAIKSLFKHKDPIEGEVWCVELAGSDKYITVSRRQLLLVKEALTENATI